MEPMYFDIDGKPIPLMTWARMQDMEHKRVAEDTIEDGVRKYWVSTVWLGLDHNFGFSGPPLIFETMVFDVDKTRIKVTEPGAWEDLMMDRYATKEQALTGHQMICDAIRVMAAVGMNKENNDE